MDSFFFRLFILIVFFSIMVNVVLSFKESFGDSADGKSIRFHIPMLSC